MLKVSDLVDTLSNTGLEIKWRLHIFLANCMTANNYEYPRLEVVITDTAHIGAAHAQVFRLYCETTATVNAMQPKGTKEWRELVNVHRQLARELCLTPATGTGLTRKVSPKRKLDKYVRAG